MRRMKKMRRKMRMREVEHELVESEAVEDEAIEGEEEEKDKEEKDEDEEDQDEEEKEDQDKEVKDKAVENEEDEKPPCNDGETCICNEPSSKHPKHKWKFTAAGRQKFSDSMTMATLRNPGWFKMYTFMMQCCIRRPRGLPEHVAGLQANSRRLQATVGHLLRISAVFVYPPGYNKMLVSWPVPEVTRRSTLDTIFHVRRIDDVETADATLSMITHLFLTMLATLERKRFMSADSEIQNLGLIMGLFILRMHGIIEYGMLEDSESEPIELKTDKKVCAPREFPSHALVYACKYNIKDCRSSRAR